ncbi:MAG TPA: class I SAM-dependent methyltransferase [Candidatus Dormibacteraeota bacterium]|nr:class I SAM-dependent methyltransferase [Candidatus Dormibacteraeota bacterium]
MSSRWSLLRDVRRRLGVERPSEEVPVVVAEDGVRTAVDSYWNEHTVNSRPFVSARESNEYLNRRASDYPLFVELMDLYPDLAGKVALDYGCGPGDDVIGFVLRSRAVTVIGMDVSDTALGLLRRRLALYRVKPARVQLIRIRDSNGLIPLPDASVDWVHCGGVLHHTTHPREIVKEFHRVMKPGAEGRLMLYNRESIWYHLWVAYVGRIVDRRYSGLTVDAAFTKSTDGPDCPVSDAWAPQSVLNIIHDAGLRGVFRGGYFNAAELHWLKTYGEHARADARLERDHRQFVADLEVNPQGYPTIHGKFAGIGGVYTITKAS